MGYSRQEYWSGLPFAPPRDLPDPRIEPSSPASPALEGRLFTTEPPGKPDLSLGKAQIVTRYMWSLVVPLVSLEQVLKKLFFMFKTKSIISDASDKLWLVFHLINAALFRTGGCLQEGQFLSWNTTFTWGSSSFSVYLVSDAFGFALALNPIFFAPLPPPYFFLYVSLSLYLHLAHSSFFISLNTY